jgi:hypothetical protein
MMVVGTVYCSLCVFWLLVRVGMRMVRGMTSVEEHLLEGQVEEMTLLLTLKCRWTGEDE